MYKLKQEGYRIRREEESRRRAARGRHAQLRDKKGRCKGKMEAYCVKCKAKREMKDAKAVTMKNGKPATQGICPDCNTKMFKIGKA